MEQVLEIYKRPYNKEFPVVCIDEWYVNSKELEATYPLSFENADRDLCFNRIEKKLGMPDSNLHFPKANTSKCISSWESGIRCAGMQGDTNHWAFNDTFKRECKYKDAPPSPKDFRNLTTQVMNLHPITQNAWTRAGGVVSGIPRQVLTDGSVQTWMAEKVSIWQAGTNDNPFGQRLTAFMISKRIIDSSVPMSLLADHSNVQFKYYREGGGVKLKCTKGFCN